MKISEIDILLIPGYGEVLDDHWMVRWAKKMPTARIVRQNELLNPDKDDWMARLLEEIATSTKPVVVVGHSLGSILIAHGAEALKGKILGAYLVAPSDWEREGLVETFDGGNLVPLPQEKLPFPAHMVASRNDPYCSYARSEEFSANWGISLQDAGEAGHINVDSGHGPWPEGMMSFAGFLSKL